MTRKINIFHSILMRRRRKMSFLFRHLIHRELYAPLLVGRGEKCYESYCKAASTKAYQGGRGLAGDELTELLRAGAACWAWGSGVSSSFAPSRFSVFRQPTLSSPHATTWMFNEL